METMGSGGGAEKQPFEVDRDLSLSGASSQEYRSVSKSLQPGKEQTIPPVRYSYDQGDIASSLDSSILQEQEAVDPLETSEDSSSERAGEPITIVTVRPAILTDSEPMLFTQGKSTASAAVQAGESASLHAFEVSAIPEFAPATECRQGSQRVEADRSLGSLFKC